MSNKQIMIIVIVFSIIAVGGGYLIFLNMNTESGPWVVDREDSIKKEIIETIPEEDDLLTAKSESEAKKADIAKEASSSIKPAIATEENKNTGIDPDSLGLEWKTYKNTAKGYSIQYPSRFGIYESKSGYVSFEDDGSYELASVGIDNRNDIFSMYSGYKECSEREGIKVMDFKVEVIYFCKDKSYGFAVNIGKGNFSINGLLHEKQFTSKRVRDVFKYMVSTFKFDN